MSKKVYMVTDQCFYEEPEGKDYNPDNRRKPHHISVVDLETGTIRQIKSGSVITIEQEPSK